MSGSSLADSGPAAAVGRAAWIGGWVPLLALCSLLACAAPPERPDLVVVTEPPASQTERYCAWYGDPRDGILYFGEAAFWSAYRAKGGDPRADLAAPGPQRIGRFDLEHETLLPALDVTEQGARSGVWDVLAHPNGRVYFTTYFEGMGFVEPATGTVVHLGALGRGLNELALVADGSILVSRYGGAKGGSGSVLHIGEDGELIAEYPLGAPPGWIAAPKSVAMDPAGGDIWVTSDLLGRPPTAPRHDAFVIASDGSETVRIDPPPEIQSVIFGPDGTGYWAEAEDRRLSLRRSPPGEATLLDAAFPHEIDFAQDIHVGADGRAVVTRWSGRVDVVEPSGAVRSVQLPQLEQAGLYYSAVLSGDRVCATYCAGVTVVCQSLPPR
jgi:hypothetical protein